METLFDVLDRVDSRTSGHSETSFAFLNRVAGPFWDRTRSKTEEWFSRLPSETQADIRGRVRSGDDSQFAGAYWEMYMHESLLREGFVLTAHPELPDAASRPDFLAVRGDTSFYVEATVIGASTLDIAAERRRSSIYDTLDRLDSPNFILGLEVNAEGTTSPPVRRLRDELDRWLRSLDVDEMAHLQGELGYDALPTYTWKTEDWSITFRPFPKKAEARGKPDSRALGLFGPQAAAVDDVGAVRADLEDKARKYGRPEEPFILAAAVESIFFDAEYTMSGALFGREAVQFDAQTLEAQNIRHPDGLWRGTAGARNTRVSAVVACRSLRPWGPTAHEPVTWHNPWAAAVLPNVLPWEEVMVDVGAGTGTRQVAKRRAHEVLGLPEGFPGPEDPFDDYGSEEQTR
jgi:hypothetical protein